MLDLITVGRAGVDLYGEQIGGRLEDMASFAKYVGGSPTNTAIGAARLGLASGLLTRVGEDHMGRFIREQLMREGVDVRGVRADPERLTALVILGIRDRDTFPLIFYRENCADMALTESDVDPAWVAQARAVLINGTHLSKPGVRAASLAAAHCVKRRGGRVVFDIDYRPVLWGLAARDRGEDRFVASREASETLQEVLPLCDLIVGTEEEMHILGGCTDTRDALAEIKRRTGALLVCKLGARGCVAFESDIPRSLDEGRVVAGFPIEVFNVLGAGDAFMAGFLRGWLRGEPLELACRWANACGALVVSRHGCAPAMPTWEELQAFMARSEGADGGGERLPFRLREDAALEQLHWATTREKRPQMLLVLDADPGDAFGAAEQRASFLSLALDAVDRAANSDPAFGILLDGEAGFEALARAAPMPYWKGRTAGALENLREWPLGQTLHCRWAPVERGAVARGGSDGPLRRLFQAARRARHELMLEIVLPAAPFLPERLPEAFEAVYDLGVRPDWWVLPADAGEAAWRCIADAMARNDRRCRGVLVRAASALELCGAAASAAPFIPLAGFVAGVGLVRRTAREFAAGRLNAPVVVASIASELTSWAAAWRQARSRMGVP